MTDVFNEINELMTTNGLAVKLQRLYEDEMKNARVVDELLYNDYDTKLRRTQLVMKWPSNDLVRQIIFDTVQIINYHNINPEKIKW